MKDFRKAMEELGEPLPRSFTFQFFPLILKHQFLCLSHQFKCLSRQFKCLSHQFKCLSKQFKCLSHQLNDMLRAADPYKEGSIRYKGNRYLLNLDLNSVPEFCERLLGHPEEGCGEKDKTNQRATE